jgi:hypothetical protein
MRAEAPARGEDGLSGLLQGVAQPEWFGEVSAAAVMPRSFSSLASPRDVEKVLVELRLLIARGVGTAVGHSLSTPGALTDIFMPW